MLRILTLVLSLSTVAMGMENAKEGPLKMEVHEKPQIFKDMNPNDFLILAGKCDEEINFLLNKELIQDPRKFGWAQFSTVCWEKDDIDGQSFWIKKKGVPIKDALNSFLDPEVSFDCEVFREITDFYTLTNLWGLDSVQKWLEFFEGKGVKISLSRTSKTKRIISLNFVLKDENWIGPLSVGERGYYRNFRGYKLLAAGDKKAPSQGVHCIGGRDCLLVYEHWAKGRCTEKELILGQVKGYVDLANKISDEQWWKKVEKYFRIFWWEDKTPEGIGSKTRYEILMEVLQGNSNLQEDGTFPFINNDFYVKSRDLKASDLIPFLPAPHDELENLTKQYQKLQEIYRKEGYSKKEVLDLESMLEQFDTALESDPDQFFRWRELKQWIEQGRFSVSLSIDYSLKSREITEEQAESLRKLYSPHSKTSLPTVLPQKNQGVCITYAGGRLETKNNTKYDDIKKRIETAPFSADLSIHFALKEGKITQAEANDLTEYLKSVSGKK